MTSGRHRSLIAGVLAVTCVATLAGAQEAVIVHVENNKQLCTVSVLVSGGSHGGIGLGFARVEISNVDDRAHSFVIDMGSPRWQGSDVHSRRSLVVEAEGQARFFLPMAIPPVRATFHAEIDGVEYDTGVNYPRGNGVVGLFVSDLANTAPQGLEVLQAIPSVYSTTAQQVPMLASDLPSDWRLFTAFSVVVVDGRANLDGDRQEALRRFAFAGGTVVVAAPERLSAGSLRELATRRVDGVVEQGLGQIVAIPAFGGDTTGMRKRLERIPQLGNRLWPASKKLFPDQDIAGLGRAPVTAFVLVILLFSIVVGPVNFWLLRRRKQPLLALVTVPVLGFGTTLVILLYGIFHDGFGVRGAVTSWTVLDQARHEVVSVVARSLFAGLAPNDLTMSADCLLLSRRAGANRDQWPDRWHWDADQERLDGGILPSRTVTPLLSVQQGTARQRLTMRRVDDETMAVLRGGGVEPVGRLVVCDLDGEFWSGDADRLRPLSGELGRKAFANFAHKAANMCVNDVGIVTEVRVPMLSPGTLAEPGSYVATCIAAPWLDEHGVRVDYDQAIHYVFGRMHSEDFVR